MRPARAVPLAWLAAAACTGTRLPELPPLAPGPAPVAAATTPPEAAPAAEPGIPAAEPVAPAIGPGIPAGLTTTASEPAAPAAEPSAFPAAAPTTPGVPAAEPEAREENPLTLVVRAGDSIRAERYDEAVSFLQKATTTASSLDLLEPGQRLRRLEGLLRDLDWTGNVARRASISRESGASGRAAQEAIAAFIAGRDVEALLLASASVGEDPQREGNRILLSSISKRTGLATPLDQLLPRAALVQRKLQLAERAVAEKRYGEAAKECQEAVWLDPKNLLAWIRLGSARWASGEPEKARQAFEEALALEPRNTEVQRFMQAKGLYGKGREAQAAREIKSQ